MARLLPSLPSTDPSPGTDHSYPGRFSPPNTSSNGGINIDEAIARHLRPPPYHNLPRPPHLPFPPAVYSPMHGGVGQRGRGRGRGRGRLHPAQFRIQGRANRVFHPNGPAIGVPFGYGHGPSHPASPNLPANVAREPSNTASVASSESFNTAEDFLTPQIRVASPTPAGMYDPDDYHHLARHQVESLLDRRAAPERFDRYEFTPQHFDDFYQSATTALVHHFTRHPAANANERQDRVRLFRFITRRCRTMTRRVV
ncbi:uncharacterized protein PGTG_17949 [Puccinia graminis f. sp. tritici CRL 75-36-700-3]|uniref:Uncharacterized protein n=1 Tax=Puccinia graminis f. sp. tritici (strain CRL 75-36-700-3 / race SCCL) TaxID=418459 RepID=E3L5U7_PUCGT|nr:uncharacterized protein PGTG_17949 [Puccinia graminis f. sp. tritici CRL 75-36-700-3]EFP91922.2 hypothetical protein PGTG_17949 [Puccinia graminis f. sp. tritici CRL 75-36-700-3]